RVEPAHVHVRGDVDVEVTKLEMGDILGPTARVAVPPGGHPVRRSAEQEVDDGDVVRCEIPEDVDIELVQTEIEPSSVDVADMSELATLDDVAQLPDGGVVLERVARHQQDAGAISGVDERLALPDAG